ncbi:retsat [Symbiodinium natans]|uniref:Retsat protein n=1 Tax=Symbiodinium natans TaxID=878477 RepID=A0A812T769_9DINO|nr:retsat [Symbiodinium natans]
MREVSTALAALAWYRRRQRARPFPPARVPEDVLRRGLRKQDLPEEADAIIIGAGPAGLALGVMLGRLGRRVLVLEQHDRAGGGLHCFQEQGYDFETGFHYAGEMRKGQELRAIVDSLTNEEVEFANLDTLPKFWSPAALAEVARNCVYQPFTLQLGDKEHGQDFIYDKARKIARLSFTRVLNSLKGANNKGPFSNPLRLFSISAKLKKVVFSDGDKFGVPPPCTIYELCQ